MYTANKKLIFFNSLCAALSKVLHLSVAVWLQQYLIKRISPEEYSLLPVVASVLVVLPLFSMAISAAIGRTVTEDYTKGNLERISDTVTASLPLVFAAGVVMLLAGGALVWRVDSVLNIPEGRVGEAQIMLSILLFLYIIGLVTAPFCVGVFVRQQNYLYNIIVLVAEGVKLAILFSLLFGVSTRVLWLVVAQAAASLIEKFLLLRASFKLMPTLKPSFRLEWPLVNRQMRFGSWVLVANLGNAVYEAMDPILLNRFSFPASVGAFHLGSLPAKHLKGLALQMTAPLQPALVGFHEHGQSKELQTIFFGIGRYTLWLQGLFICPAIVYGAKLFELYLGNRYAVYHEAPYAMTLTLIAWIPYYSLYGLRWLAYAHERIKWFNLITLGSQVANLALTWFFLARLGWGAIGSGLASLIALWLFFCVGFFPLSIHSFNISPVQYLKDTVLRGLLPWIACTAVLFLLRPIVVSWRGLLLASMAGAAVYGVCLLLCLHGIDRANLNRALKAVARRFQKTPEL